MLLLEDNLDITRNKLDNQQEHAPQSPVGTWFKVTVLVVTCPTVTSSILHPRDQLEHFPQLLEGTSSTIPGRNCSTVTKRNKLYIYHQEDARNMLHSSQKNMLHSPVKDLLHSYQLEHAPQLLVEMFYSPTSNMLHSHISNTISWKL